MSSDRACWSGQVVALWASASLLLVSCQAPPLERGAGGEVAAAAIEITGVLTDEGVECRALRGDDRNLYTIGRGFEEFADGERVRVVGSVAEMSFCMQGTTLNVSHIERL